MKKANNFYDKLYRYLFKKNRFVEDLVKFAFPKNYIKKLIGLQ